MTTQRGFKANGRLYFWGGGFGNVITSFERRRQLGDTRVIEEQLFYVCDVRPRWLFVSRVCWTMQDVTGEKVRKFRRKVFGCE